MPRIYSDNQTHTENWGAVDFINGVAAVPEGQNTALWEAHSYAIDPSKHALTVFDELDRADIESTLTYLGVSFVAGDTKQALVRKAETFASTHLLATLTVTSVAGTASKDSKVTVTAGAIGTEGNTLAFKTGPDAYTTLYKDVPGKAYTAFLSGADITPAAETDDTITVVELNAAGEVVSRGTVALTVKA